MRSRKVQKLELQEVVVDLAYVSALERAFMINLRTDESTPDRGEEAKLLRDTGGQAVL